MSDHVNKSKRSEIMRAVKNKNSGPEIVLRQQLFRLGFRYRIHVPNLRGKPDIVFPKKKKIIFVHGCFWHGHDCTKGRLPKSNLNFWEEKICRNKDRDIANIAELQADGWKVLIVWQCELKRPEFFNEIVVPFLSDT